MVLQRQRIAMVGLAAPIVALACFSRGPYAKAEKPLAPGTGRASPNKPEGAVSPGQETKQVVTCVTPVAGTWRGRYEYPGGQRRPVRFVARLEMTSTCRFKGRMEEPNTFGRQGVPKLYATLVGRVRGRTISFVEAI